MDIGSESKLKFKNQLLSSGCSLKGYVRLR